MLFKLFLTFFKIGAFSFGGGYAMLSMIQQEVVTIHKWIESSEFVDMVAISQGTPGPIAINMATYIGFKVCGIKGAIYSTLGVIMPSIIIMVIITNFFIKFKQNTYINSAFLALRPATIGLIGAAGILVSKGTFIDYKSYIIFLLSFIFYFKYKLDPILMIVIGGILGYFLY